jgi:hypothetical protein
LEKLCNKQYGFNEEGKASMEKLINIDEDMKNQNQTVPK